jgi:hypothetical protein
MRVACLSSLIFLDLITIIIFGENANYEALQYVIFFHPTINSSFWGLNNVFSTLKADGKTKIFISLLSMSQEDFVIYARFTLAVF